MKKDWTEIVKDKLSESEVTPPDALWEGISSQLDAKLPQSQPGLKPRPQIQRKRLRLAVAACLAALVGTVAYIAITNEQSVLTPVQSPGERVAQNMTTESSFQNDTSLLEEQTLESRDNDVNPHSSLNNSFGDSSHDTDPVINNVGSTKKNAASNNLSSKCGLAHNPSSQRNVHAQVDEPLQNHKEETVNTYADHEENINGVHESVNPLKNANVGDGVELALSEDKVTEENVNQYNQQQRQDAYVDSVMNYYKELMENGHYPFNESNHLVAENSGKLNRGLSLEVYTYRLGMAHTGSSEGIYGDISSSYFPSGPGDNIDSSTPSDGPDFVNPEGPDSSEETQSRSYNVNDQKKAKHHQPLRFGLSLRYPLSSSISISTGLVYSRLSSTFPCPKYSLIYFDIDQTLNYLGIPISIEYKLPSFQKVGFYLTLGGLIEKCVYGKAKDSNSSVSHKVSERAFQTSSFVGAGIEYNLNHSISIYAEPLATYYFDNHSKIINIYKDRKLNFDLRIGLRWNLKR